MSSVTSVRCSSHQPIDEISLVRLNRSQSRQNISRRFCSMAGQTFGSGLVLGMVRSSSAWRRTAAGSAAASSPAQPCTSRGTHRTCTLGACSLPPPHSGSSGTGGASQTWGAVGSWIDSQSGMAGSWQSEPPPLFLLLLAPLLLKRVGYGLRHCHLPRDPCDAGSGNRIVFADPAQL